MKNKKDSKIKSFYNSLKEAWKDPRKKAGIKLLSYFIFFIILFLLAFITNQINKTNNINKEPDKTTKVTDTYINKLNSLLTDKYNIEYTLNNEEKVLKIDGVLNNNQINGYLEYDNTIKKIVIKDNNIYEIVNDVENIINLDYDISLLNLNNLITLLKSNSPIKEVKDNISKYTYNVTYKDLSLNIVVSMEEYIKKIDITNETLKYYLIFDK